MSRCRQCGVRCDERSRFCECCGAALFAVTSPQPPEWAGQQVAARVLPERFEAPRKRIGLAVLLAALFGPLGLVYSSVLGACTMLLASCFLYAAACEDWLSNDLYSLLIAWPVCIVWAAIATGSFNRDHR